MGFCNVAESMCCSWTTAALEESLVQNKLLSVKYRQTQDPNYHQYLCEAVNLVKIEAYSVPNILDKLD